jgi:hypothetical protein
MYKIRGKILDSKTETIESKKGDTFEKMLITLEETESGFNQKHQLEIFGKESIEAQQGKVEIGSFVKIDFYIKSNEWKGKFFVSLNVKDILVEDQATKLTEDLPF